jgi:hypothetical protein
LLVDGTTVYSIGGNQALAGAYGQCLGSAMFSIGPLTVAPHTLLVQLLSLVAGAAYCRSNTLGAFEYLFAEVWEFIA